MKRTHPSNFLNGQKDKTKQFTGDEKEMAKKHQEVRLSGNPYCTLDAIFHLSNWYVFF